MLTGTVHNRVGKMLLRYAAVPGGRPLGDVTDQELKALVRAAKGFALPVRGTEGFESAQVTAGGIRDDGQPSRARAVRLRRGAGH